MFIFTSGIFPVSLPDSISNAKKTDASKMSAAKLQLKILLSDEQTDKVRDILNDYLAKNSTTGENTAPVQEKIAGLLDEKQKAKFDIIKIEWMNSFMKEVKKSAAK